MKKISVRRGLILAKSIADLVKLEALMGKTELMKDPLVSRPRRCNPMIIFGVDSNLPEDDIVPAILKKNDSLEELPS